MAAPPRAQLTVGTNSAPQVCTLTGTIKYYGPNISVSVVHWPAYDVPPGRTTGTGGSVSLAGGSVNLQIRMPLVQMNLLIPRGRGDLVTLQYVGAAIADAEFV
jgi:hypothetical protein